MAIKVPSELKILIVEDEPLITKIMVQFLRKKFSEAEVTCKENGTEAMEFLHENQQIDLIISDVMMPDMDGIRFIQTMSEDEQLSKIPVVVCSSLNHEKEDELLALAPNVEIFLRKPVNPKVLVEKVGAILSRSLTQD